MADALSGDPALNAVAGASAAAAVLATLFPIDVAKTHMQARGVSAAATLRTLLDSPRPLRAFYGGIGPALGEQTLNRCMLFGVGAAIKRRVPTTWPEPVRDASSGAAAALCKTVLLHPLDTIKCRWQLGMGAYGGAAGGGVSGLYAGVGPATLRSSVGMAIWLSSRNHLERTLPDDEGFWRTSRHFWAGALSSALTDLCTFPFDTLKKWMQADASAAAASGSGGAAGAAAGAVLGAVRRLRSEGGLRRFYFGYGPRLLMISVNGALFNAAFVSVKGRLESMWPAVARDLNEIAP